MVSIIDPEYQRDGISREASLLCLCILIIPQVAPENISLGITCSESSELAIWAHMTTFLFFLSVSTRTDSSSDRLVNMISIPIARAHSALSFSMSLAKTVLVRLSTRISVFWRASRDRLSIFTITILSEEGRGFF